MRHPLRSFFSLNLHLILILCLVETPRIQAENAGGSGAVIDTQTEGLWSSAPFEFLDGKKFDRTTIENGDTRHDWVRPPKSLQDLCGGVKITKDSSGALLLEWRHHEKYPTLATRTVPHDWTSYGSISIACYSAKATGERITLGVLADNPETPYLDYWSHDFKIDWTGWKAVTLPLAEFEKLGEPASWSNITGLYFFTKAKKQSPSPRTVLYFHEIHLLPGTSPATTSAVTTPGEDISYNTVKANGYDAPVILNHSEPELLSNLEPGKPLVGEFYFQGARAAHGYYPRFNPGYVNFDPQGNAYLHSVSSIDWLDASGQWHRNDLTVPIREFCRQNHYAGFDLNCRSEMDLRFDRDGDAYVITALSLRDSEGREKGRTALLLHARGGITRPWTCYKLPLAWEWEMEKLDGHNQDALDHPPVLANGGGGGGHLLIPEKKPDGSLDLSKLMTWGDGKLEEIFVGPTHSGKGNFLVTQGSKIYIVYASVPRTNDSKNVWSKPDDPAWRAHLNIPPDHPANKLMLDPVKGKPSPSSDGLPTFVRAYDRNTQSFSDPVFIGYGGRARDVHNWSAMTADSRGLLHVIISGHCDPPVYTHTLNPGDITQWSPPVLLASAPGSDGFTKASYPSLTCDKHDNLLYTFRDDTGVYDHRIGMMSRHGSTGEWSAEKSVVVPPTDGYHVWGQKLTYDSIHDRHYLTFYEHNWMTEFLSPDEYLFSRFIWPSTEVDMTRNYAKGGDNSGMPKGMGRYNFVAAAGETTVLVTDDTGKTWRLATTPDFAGKP